MGMGYKMEIGTILIGGQCDLNFESFNLDHQELLIESSRQLKCITGEAKMSKRVNGLECHWYRGG